MHVLSHEVGIKLVTTENAGILLRDPVISAILEAPIAVGSDEKVVACCIATIELVE